MINESENKNKKHKFDIGERVNVEVIVFLSPDVRDRTGRATDVKIEEGKILSYEGLVRDKTIKGSPYKERYFVELNLGGGVYNLEDRIYKIDKIKPQFEKK